VVRNIPACWGWKPQSCVRAEVYQKESFLSTMWVVASLVVKSWRDYHRSREDRGQLGRRQRPLLPPRNYKLQKCTMRNAHVGNCIAACSHQRRHRKHRGRRDAAVPACVLAAPRQIVQCHEEADSCVQSDGGLFGYVLEAVRLPCLRRSACRGSFWRRHQVPLGAARGGACLACCARSATSDELSSIGRIISTQTANKLKPTTKQYNGSFHEADFILGGGRALWVGEVTRQEPRGTKRWRTEETPCHEYRGGKT